MSVKTLNMTQLYRLAIIVSVFLLGAGTLFAGAAAADDSTLEEIDGEGTEDDPYVITDAEELQAIEEDLDAHYVLGNDIDASETETWDAGAGFDPIGDQSGEPFQGSFDGQDHAISELHIDRPTEDNVALFGYSAGTIKNVNLEDVEISGDGLTGTLSGYTTGTVQDTSATGTTSGGRYVGGLAALVSEEGTIEKSGANVDVTGGDNVGGLLGGFTHDNTIIEVYATGDVEATDSNSYSGGLIGQLRVHDDNTIRLVYSTADVSGEYTGGLVGANGRSLSAGSIDTGYAAGQLNGDTSGGSVGTERDGSYANTFWDTRTSGDTDGYGTGLTTDQMTGSEAASNMDGFDFDNFWTLTDEYPILEWQVEDVSLSLDESTVGEGEATSATVTLTLDDGSTVTASEVADYDAGGIADVDAGTVDARQQGTTEITATVAGESDSVELEITEPPQIELEGTELDADAVVEGSSLTATATYENDGGPGSHTAELIADGDVVDSQIVSLDADDETTIDFAWTPTDPAGTEYEIAIDDTDLGSVEVVEPGTVTLSEATFPDRVGSGAPYEFTVDLENNAGETVIDTVAYERDDEFVFTEPIAVDPDGTTEILGDETDADVGLTIAHEVTVHDETLTGTSDVTDPPEFEVDAVDAPDEVEPDEEFELTATIENTGGVEGTQTVSVSDDENTIETEELTIESGASEEVSIAVTETETGDYEYTVETDDEETTASVTVAETESDDDADDSDGLPGFGVAAAIVALSIALVARRQR